MKSILFKKAYVNASRRHDSPKSLVVVLGTALVLSVMPFGVNAAVTSNTVKETTGYQMGGVHQADLLAYYCNDAIEAQTKHPKYASDDRKLIDCMLTELATYRKDERQPIQQYFAYKAQGWLNYATYQDSSNHRSEAGRLAVQSAHNILEALRNNQEQSLSLTVDIPKTSALMRPDLWATLSALKEQGAAVITPRELALSEVALVWAAAEHCDRGWRKSGPTFRMAERWLAQAREAYVNANDAQTNVLLEEITNQYFKLYEPLDVDEDTCEGQKLPVIS